MYYQTQVTGKLLDSLTCWDALRAALPVGTVSGAPKVLSLFEFPPSLSFYPLPALTNLKSNEYFLLQPHFGL